MRILRLVWLACSFAGLALSSTILRAQARPDYIPPKLIAGNAPDYPTSLKEEGIVGQADIVLTVGVDGQVTDLAVAFSTQPEFGLAAKEALAKCRFSPALKAGQPITRRIEVPVNFSIPDEEVDEKERRRNPEPLPPGPATVSAEAIEQLPELIKEVKTKYPPTLLNERKGGEALIGLVVDENGAPQDVHTVLATHRAVAAASVTAIKEWRFRPGRHQGVAVRTAMRVIMNFNADDPDLAGPRIRPGVVHFVETAKDGARKQAPGKEKIVPPRVVSQKEPEVTNAMMKLRAQEDVLVNFVVNEFGVVTHVRAVRGPHPYYLVAAERAVSYWKFKPGTKDGKPARMKMSVPIRFQVSY